MAYLLLNAALLFTMSGAPPDAAKYKGKKLKNRWYHIGLTSVYPNQLWVNPLLLLFRLNFSAARR